jgi:hypothetical protein
MYMSATYDQVKNQFFAALSRFRARPAFTGWTWLENEVRNRDGGFLFGRSSDVGGFVEGIHDQHDSRAGLLIDIDDIFSAKSQKRSSYYEPPLCWSSFFRLFDGKSCQLRNLDIGVIQAVPNP